MSKQSRRDFMKGAATGTVAAAGITQAPGAQAQSGISVNPAARALMPNGELVDRAQILRQLNLNPNTSPEAWLAIVACGSNKAASPDSAVLEGLKNKTLKLDDLSVGEVRRLQENLKNLMGP